jgi:putative ABC transport system permease protein
MIKNYLKISIRNLLKQRSFTFINVFGFAIGMTCFILIMLYVRYELSYDRFIKNSDRIYRVAIERKYPDKVRNWGRTALPVAATFQEEFPEIIQGTRLITNDNALLVTYGDKNIYSSRVVFGDPNFFEVFSIPLIKGSPKAALAEPNSVVLSQEASEMVFGDADPMSKTLAINNVDYSVTGITKNLPGNSHFHFDFLLSTSTISAFDGQEWINAWGAFTYILVQGGVEPESLEAKFPEMVKKYMAPEVVDEVKSSFEDFVAAGNGYRFFLQRLEDIHLRSNLDQEIEANGNIAYIYIFSAVSIFVLLIACINFMNLTTARSANRIKEVGVRKTVGSTRGQLIVQFLLESTILSFVALVIALCAVQFLLPSFRNITDRPLDLDVFSSAFVLPGLILFILIMGLLSGSYPAFFLSSFQPIAVLKGRRQKGSLHRWLRNGLVVFQFTVSIVLIIATLVVGDQIEFMLNKDLGFDKEHVVVIKNGNVLQQRVQAFKQSLLAIPSVSSVSGSFNVPGEAFDGNVHKLEGETDERAVSISVIFADYDYVETMGMEIVSGRNFSLDFSTDRQNTYVLNETAVKMLGIKEPIGARITDHFRMYSVIGVLKDFHFKSLHSEISPVAYVANPGIRANFVCARISPRDIPGTLSALEKKWKEFTGGQPFEYSFLDDELTAHYEAEQKTRQITGLFSFIAIFIGCLGLFGLAAYIAEQRTKEIGIRRILGASVLNIVFLQVKEFTKLVALAFLIATPLAYLGIQRWLHNFAYSIELTLPPFVVAGLVALLIALITVSFQAVKAAFNPPVESLRYE